METLREYRIKVNVSQSVMAEILKTTRSQISMAERGDRPLPPDAVRRFKIMQRISIDFPPALSETNLIIPDDAAPAIEAIHIWEQRLAQNRYQHYQLKNQLLKMKHDFSAVTSLRTEWWKATIAIRESGGSQPEIDFFNDKQKQIQPKILTCGRIAQLRLQLSIDLLLAEASLLTQYLVAATADTGPPMEPIAH